MCNASVARNLYKLIVITLLDPASYPTGREHSVSNRDQCIDICSSSSNCKWSHFEDASNRCYTYDGNFVDAPVPADSSWSAYIKV